MITKLRLFYINIINNQLYLFYEGFIGDRFGYRTLLMISMILFAGALTASDFTPTYSETKETVSSHMETFIFYSMCKVIAQIFGNNLYNILDSTALAQAKMYHGDYSYVMFICQFGGLISSALAALTIRDPGEGSNGEINLIIY